MNVDPCSDPRGLISSGMLAREVTYLPLKPKTFVLIKVELPTGLHEYNLYVVTTNASNSSLEIWLAVGLITCLHKPIPQWSTGIASAITELVMFKRGGNFWPLKCFFFLTHLRCSIASVPVLGSSFEKRL